MVVFFLWPPPTSVIGWFALFQDNALVGLLDMDLLLIVDYLLLIGLFSALWASLRRANESLMAIALILQLVATASYLASTVAFEMLSLSNQYATATTDAERSLFLAAGQMLVTWQGTAFDVSYVLSALAVLIVSAVMLRSHIICLEGYRICWIVCRCIDVSTTHSGDHWCSLLALISCASGGMVGLDCSQAATLRHS
ncbi:MAG TPA: hypothetical protein VE544_14095 [Nitrososphaeraceae archaeon]|jgi:hypothetical protein|nr:hypothetical protein [Nitrososphaeraceae archaeon]